MPCVFFYLRVKCSSDCGQGVQTRLVFCGSIDGTTVSRVDEALCDPSKRYDNVTTCQGTMSDCAGKWFTGPWNQVHLSNFVQAESFFKMVISCFADAVFEDVRNWKSRARRTVHGQQSDCRSYQVRNRYYSVRRRKVQCAPLRRASGHDH